MKKNISINISGIIFHIEEDGYDLLKNYLDSVHRYFASYDGSEEIIADIEARAAELFMTKLKTDKQIITAEDVQTLIKTLGSIKDFQALEEEGGDNTTSAPHQRTENESKQQYRSSANQDSKRLQRDLQRKKLGGVASGLANYFGIDAIWIRLMFVLLFVFWGFGLLPYVILWIAVPGADNLTEDEKLKKFYRNPDRKVLGGVASGLSSYLNVEIALIRLAFLIMLIPGGVGLIVYIILWIITPEANTITEKMKMQGEPVTLSNIENRVKNEFNSPEGEESFIVKILLFPFRVIAAVFEFLAKILGPIVTFVFEAIRIIFGLFITGVGLSFLISVLIAALVLLGLYTEGDWLQTGGIPIDLIIYSLPMPIALAAFVLFFIPSLALTLGGISLISKTTVMHKALGLSLLFFWIISIVVLALFVPATISDFRRETQVVEKDLLSVESKTMVIKANEITNSDWRIKNNEGSINAVNLRLMLSKDSTFSLVKEFESFGRNLNEAEENARMVSYHYSLNDSVLTLDEMIDFKPGALFRFQTLDLTLYIPKNTPIVLDRSISDMLEGYPYYLNETSTWMYNDTEFVCLDCSEESAITYHIGNDSVGFEGFTDLEISHFFDVTITQGEEYDVRVENTHELSDHVDIHRSGSVLVIELRDYHWFRKRFRNFDDRIKVNIVMPELLDLEASGAVKVRLESFNQDYMKIDLAGASHLTAKDCQLDELEIDASGASEAIVSGQGRRLVADIDGASRLTASYYEVRNANVDVAGASKAKVFVTDQLDINASGASKVIYKGRPEINSNRSGAASIDRE